MKKITNLLAAILALSTISSTLFAQVEIKGSGTTSATSTLITKNGNNDTSMIIHDDGRIGIGTTNPLTKLDVNGVINARSGVMYPDGLTQTITYTGAPILLANTFTVAAFGGNFTTISAAIAACVAPAANNRYLIEVMPGTYVENVTCVKFVNLRGAGKYASTVNGFVVASDSIVIEGFYITGGIQCPGVSPTILHNIITNNLVLLGHGIDVNAPGKPWIKENEILGCLGWGIRCKYFFADAWIIANKILDNQSGGIFLDQSSPTISNNLIDYNHNFGIFMQGAIGTPTEPTISDNVIGHTDYMLGGVGIFMMGYGEPRIISNDIYLNECGIFINPMTQPSIIGNNINYNFEAGIRCFSNGAAKRVVITGNHLHSNCHMGGVQPAGIWIQDSRPMVTLNNITQNNVPPALGLPDIDYSPCVANFPTISTNIYDIIIRSGGPPAPGIYNSTSFGLAIAP
jgi:parallel beta-helix repeat protein